METNDGGTFNKWKTGVMREVIQLPKDDPENKQVSDTQVSKLVPQKKFQATFWLTIQDDQATI